ncbi:MAG TPA: hypothetical protein VIM12_06195 [Noviherbaspirillum sp.]|jgi:hypothetical protein|uniref:hypothetical protein n=1 Tax=Noviherbaspirillum sp. TaxID=1926288 RepID=UPI002F91CD15
MKERPILFSAPMVRAILDGTKTQTRRVVKPQFAHDAVPAEMSSETAEGWQTTGHSGLRRCDTGGAADDAIRCPYGIPGNRLWVKETWAAGQCADGLAPSQLHPGTWLQENGGLWYPADGTAPARPISPRGKTRVSIHMPRWASRITLEITCVRVERLNGCSDADAIAEGIDRVENNFGNGPAYCDYRMKDPKDTSEWLRSPVASYRTLWEQINGAGSWDLNPWVWVVEFKRIAATKEAA